MSEEGHVITFSTMHPDNRKKLLRDRLKERMAQKDSSPYKGPWAPDYDDWQDVSSSDEDPHKSVINLISDEEDWVEVVSSDESEKDEKVERGRTREGAIRFPTLSRILQNMDETEDSTVSSEDREKLAQIKYSNSGQLRTKDLEYDPLEDPVLK